MDWDLNDCHRCEMPDCDCIYLFGEIIHHCVLYFRAVVFSKDPTMLVPQDANEMSGSMQGLGRCSYVFSMILTYLASVYKLYAIMDHDRPIIS